MEENQRPDGSSDSFDRRICVNCDHPVTNTEFRTSLCADCRPHFIKFPIPNWIKLFAAGVVIALLFSLYTFPGHLSSALHLERGKKAEQRNCFHTAQQEFEAVLKKVPDHKEAKAHLMLAAFYNENNELFFKMGEELGGQKIDDETLLGQVNSAMDQFNSRYPGDSLLTLRDAYGTYEKMPDSTLVNFLKGFPQDIFANLMYASRLVDKDDYKTADSILAVVLDLDNTNLAAYRLLAASKRASGDYNASLSACDHILDINNECGGAYAAKARTLLKQKKDKEALKLALHGVELDRENPYNIATLALSYHFNNENEKCNELIQEVKSSRDSTKIEFMQYAIDVIDQKEKFRN